jgi:hypothetical protein
MKLDISSKGLRNLPDIPDNIEYLDCSGNDIRRIEKLPGGLKYLNCANNSLEVLTNLPSSIETLKVDFNLLSALDLSKCQALHSLSIAGNKFMYIPKLPDSVKVLHISFNNIKMISGLNPNLLELEAHNCNLESMGDLPDSVMILKCDNNDLKRLPSLPANLRLLSCCYNNLQFLPPLPPRVQSVICDGNQLSILPALPDSLEVLCCNNNKIAYLPELPENLTDISFRDNPVYNNERFQREYGVAEQEDEPDIPGLVKKYKVHIAIDEVPDENMGTAFDFINLEDVNIVDYLKENDNNIVIAIGEARYACNRDELFTYLNTPGVRFVYETHIFFKLPWNQIVYYSDAMLINILDFKIFQIVGSQYTVKRNNQVCSFYNIEPVKIVDFLQLCQK